MSKYSIPKFTARAQEYLRILGPYVNLWEIGNEINGDWLGPDAASKAMIAHRTFKNAGKQTVLTGYYNCECEDKNGPMLDWLSKLDKAFRSEIDLFTISYYEDDCENRVVGLPEWVNVFNQASVLFPNAKLAIGECGTQKKRKKVEYMKRYYSMRLPTSKFVGGFFWWYGYQDLIEGNCLRSTFSSVIV